MEGVGSQPLIGVQLLAGEHRIVGSLDVCGLDGGQLPRREQPLERLLVGPLGEGHGCSLPRQSAGRVLRGLDDRDIVMLGERARAGVILNAG